MEPETRQIAHQDVLKDTFQRKPVTKPDSQVEILDLEELKDFQGRKRSEFENVLKVKRLDIKQWIRYAQFEIEQHDLRRARSVFERALLVNNSHVPLWLRYIDCELKSKNVNHARNLLERATNLLPRVDKLWLKYVIVEESLGNVAVVRRLYGKWCSLQPGRNAFDAFVEFEIRYQEFENARKVYARYVLVYPGVETWLKWVNFEKKHGTLITTRQALSLGLDTLALYESTPERDIATFVSAFAEWEATQQEHERASALYQLAMNKWPSNELLASAHVQFAKMYSTSSALDESIMDKRKREYRSSLAENSSDYDLWWLYLDLLQKHFPHELPDELERSVIDNNPEDQNKSLSWRRYIFLWIRVLTYFELHMRDLGKTKDLFEKLTKEIIPNKRFTFAKVWNLYAKFELRQGHLTAARKLLGYALGTCPKNRIYKNYIELEIRLKEFDRVRKLYEQYIAYDPTAVETWVNYAELEENLGDDERARAIYRLAASEEVGLGHEKRIEVMRKLISYETTEGEFARASSAYKDLLQLSSYDSGVWIEMALYESSIPTEEQLLMEVDASSASDEEEGTLEVTEKHKQSTRQVFEQAISYYRNKSDKQGRQAVLRALSNYEEVHGTAESQRKVKERLPVVKYKTKLEGGIEVEYLDLEFPDDSENHLATDKKSKLLAMAQKWQQEKKSS
ncbi:LAME_0G07668g1_1 [Lachancea meyersii CBS 8951]|uniref:Pre-mRNA-splicing factor CLF1 n=1 Tax=Lachancea meyersii CBS 8951 TaxID=1266667 RepID=A0A1G4K814_9SACH|nr:LAME_0G07668g1_1 [Lachancea meyersii CBS 8951]